MVQELLLFLPSPLHKGEGRYNIPISHNWQTDQKGKELLIKCWGIAKGAQLNRNEKEFAKDAANGPK
jgi:hypothetical protein